MSNTIARVVSIHYTLTNDQGEVIDSSRESAPLSYLEGAQNIIPGLEKELQKMAVGESRKVSVSPEEGYGTHDAGLVQQVPLAAFQGVDKVEPGMQFQANTENGPQLIVVTAVSDTLATIDANHPLAGQTLHFDVEIMEVREASEEELAHGHVHGPGGHHHH